MKRIFVWMFVGVILLTAVVFADTTDSADTTAFADSTALADSTVADSAAVDSAALLLTEKLLGDVSDGSRAVPVHRIPLYTEQGEKILPNDDVVLPFSTRRTCGDCHNYNVVKTGWHFNSMDSTVQPGRPGEPWVLVDAGTGTQLPLSYRNWPGTFRPEQLDITPWKFTQLFGSHMPGGGPGEVDSTVPEEIVRGFVSGRLEINCLSCHDADPRHDQAEYATQIVRQNFRWAAAATCGFASVSGSARSMDDTYDPFMPPIIDNPTVQPPAISYKKGIFDSKKRVFFDIRRKAPAERCYFCHSTHDLDEGNGEKWEADTDVHLAAGLTCTDCHRNGVDHAIVRGYEKESEISDNPLAASMTCQGCHLGSDDSGSKPARGRLGAPVPEHPGLPLVHFEKLSCTACHSGPWPDKKPHQIKTSMAHKLGTHGVLKTRDVLPHIYAPVFVKNEENKIAPHKLIWPAYWGRMTEDKVSPINPEKVWPVIESIVSQDSAGYEAYIYNVRRKIWPAFSDDFVQQILDSLTASSLQDEGRPVYISGGKLYRLSETGELITKDDPAAQPYTWPLAHNVRPASQSLGVRGCSDCHTTNAALFFARVDIDTPVQEAQAASKPMAAFHKLGVVFPWVFGLSFIFRPLLKIIVIIASVIVLAVLLLYIFKGINYLVNAFAEEK